MTRALDAVSPTLAPQDVRDELTFAVVGGGASGVELATKMSDLLTDAFRRRGLKGEPHVLIFEMSDRLVPGMGEEVRAYVEKTLLESHIDIHLETRVLEVKPSESFRNTTANERKSKPRHGLDGGRKSQSARLKNSICRKTRRFDFRSINDAGRRLRKCFRARRHRQS
jgi:NADH dehydrogenase FAD-containing subunit